MSQSLRAGQGDPQQDTVPGALGQASERPARLALSGAWSEAKLTLRVDRFATARYAPAVTSDEYGFLLSGIEPEELGDALRQLSEAEPAVLGRILGRLSLPGTGGAA